MRILVYPVALLSLAVSAWALQLGGQCDPQPFYSTGTWQYIDSCDNVYLFCDPTTNNTCNYKGCANSDYIKDWDTSLHKLPQRCPAGTYCPDNNSKCMPQVSIGSHCEMQRDDECAGPISICLNATCFPKGVPRMGNCGVDRTVYTSFDAEHQPVEQTIIRDNCTAGTYCDNENSWTCIAAKTNGQPCDQDGECLSETCSLNGICVNGPDVFHQIPSWLWGVLGVSVVLFVLLILGALWILHRYQSKKEHEKIAKFFGDNEDFAKYVDDDDIDGDSDFYEIRNDNRSTVYLTTPDYEESSRLSMHSQPKNRSTSKLIATQRPESRTSTTGST